MESKDGFLTSSDTPSNASLFKTLQYEFPEVFDPSRRSRIIRHSIIALVETTTEMPVTARARKFSSEKFRGLQAEIKRLLDQGILERSQSAWSCPIVMVSKKDGSFRLCADLVALNKILKVQKHSLPNINDFMSLAHGCNWFSSLDVKDAYYNILVKESDLHKLAITCPLGNFSYKYLPMGHASSSSYYQRLINEVVTVLSNVFCYFDDIIVMTRDFKEHKPVLRTLLSRPRDHGLILYSHKCVIAVYSLLFLGYHVSSTGVAPSEAKVAAIQNGDLHRTKRQLRRYLGMHQFYSQFVKNCAKWLQSPHDLVAQSPNNQPLLWSENQKHYFELSKAALEESTLLAFPDPTAKLELVTNASGDRFCGRRIETGSKWKS